MTWLSDTAVRVASWASFEGVGVSLGVLAKKMCG